MKIGGTDISSIKIGSTTITKIIKDGVTFWTASPTTTLAVTTTSAPTTTASGEPPSFLIIDGNTIGWYSTEEANVIKDGSNLVSQWKDLSGNTRHLTSTGSAQPVWSSTGITFDGVDDYLSITSLNFAQPFTIYLLYKEISYLSGADIIQLQYLPIARIEMGTTGAGYVNAHFGEILGDVYAGSDTFVILRAVINTNSSKIQINENTAITGSAGDRICDMISIGKGGTCSNVQVKELIIRNVVDSSSDEQAVYNYLNTKYTIY